MGFQRVSSRIDYCAHKEVGFPGKLVPRKILSGIEGLNKGDELDGIQVEHGLGLRVVAQRGIVPREGQNVLDPQSPGAQKIRLQSQTISVPTGYLEDGLKALALDKSAQGPGTHAYQRGLKIGHVEGMDQRSQAPDVF
jgi:hypothetical protein